MSEKNEPGENHEGLDFPKMPETHTESVLLLASAMVRTALWPTLGAYAACVILFGVLFSTPGVLGALVGGAIAIGCAALTIFLMRKSAPHGPHIAMAASLGGFVFKMLVLFIFVLLLRDVEALHPKALGITMVVLVLTTAGAEMVAFRRTKIPTIIPAGEK